MKRTSALIFLLFSCISAFAQGASGADARKTLAENLLVGAVSKMETDPAKAAGELAYIDKHFPADDAVKYYLGLLAYSEGDYAGAEENLREAVALDSANLWYKDALAGLYASLGRNYEAADLYIPLVQKHPSSYMNPYILVLVGDRYLSTMRDSLALDSYNKALALSPDYTPAVLGRAEVSRLGGNMPDFFSDIRTFVGDPSMNPYSKCNYISQLINHIDYPFYRTWGAQLDTLVNTCVRVHPADSSSLKLAGAWYYSTDRREQGRVFYDRLLENYPEDLSAHYIRLSILYEEGSMAEVLEECRKIVEIGGERNPQVIPALSTAGDCWHAIGNDRNAMKYYDKVLKMDPENVLTLNNYAYYLSLAGKKLAKAEKMSRITVEKEPDNPSYLDTYGWILHLRGRDAEAKPYFKRAMVYGGKDHLEILEHYAVVLEALGDTETAKYYRTLAANKKAAE